jgi:hypothetical protein
VKCNKFQINKTKVSIKIKIKDWFKKGFAFDCCQLIKTRGFPDNFIHQSGQNLKLLTAIQKPINAAKNSKK